MTKAETARGIRTYRRSAPRYHSLIHHAGRTICSLAGLVLLAACQTSQPQPRGAAPTAAEVPEKKPEEANSVVEPFTPIKASETARRAESGAKVGDLRAMAPIKIPADGSYTGTTVNGSVVRSVHILDDGRKVRVSETALGQRNGRVVLELERSDDAPAGYFTSARMDTDSDGELAGEFVKKGVWRMDEKGNIRQLR